MKHARHTPTSRTTRAATCALACALLGGGLAAHAQAPAAPAPPQVTHGAPVPGVCVFSGDGAIGGTGDAANDAITGNGGSDALAGLVDKDTLYGGGAKGYTDYPTLSEA